MSEWSASSIYAIKSGPDADGTLEFDLDAPRRHVVKRTWRDEQGRRCHRFAGEAYTIEDAEMIAAALNAASAS